MAAGLTEKQRLFCDEYLIDLNATRAYKAAYPSVKGDASAAVCATKLLRNAKVKAYVHERMQDRQERVELTQDMVLREIMAIAFADATDIVSCDEYEHVRIASTSSLTEKQRKSIAGIKQGEFGVEVKMYDRLKALELLGKHLGMFERQKDELDRKEQEARINRLRSETHIIDVEDKGGVLILPMIGDDLVPPESSDE